MNHKVTTTTVLEDGEARLDGFDLTLLAGSPSGSTPPSGALAGGLNNRPRSGSNGRPQPGSRAGGVPSKVGGGDKQHTQNQGDQNSDPPNSDARNSDLPNHSAQNHGAQNGGANGGGTLGWIESLGSVVQDADPTLLACWEALGKFVRLDRKGASARRRSANLVMVAWMREQVGAVCAILAAEAEHFGSTQVTSGVDTATRLAQVLGGSARQAHGLVKQGEVLGSFPVLGEAAQLGGLNQQQAQVCAKQLADFPVTILGDKALEQAQRQLVVEAKQLDTVSLEQRAKGLVNKALVQARIDPAEREELEHRKAIKQRHIWFNQTGASMRFGGQLPVGLGLRWQQTLQTMARQTLKQPSGRSEYLDEDRASFAALMIDAQSDLVNQAAQSAALGKLTTGHTTRRHTTGPHTTGPHTANPHTADPQATSPDIQTPTPANRHRGANSLEHTGNKPPDSNGGVSVRVLPQVLVVVRAEDLALGVPAGVSVDGTTPASNSEIARWLCDSQVRRIVVNSASEVLDVGRNQRFVTKAIRLALEFRDGGCCFPGCDQPVGACEAHHLVPWWAGGETNLNNLVLLCPRHHEVIEPSRTLRKGTIPDAKGFDDPWRWQIQINPTHGHPQVIPPQRLDPQRKPQLHARIQLKLQKHLE